MMNCIIDKNHIYVKTPFKDKDWVFGYLNGIWNAKRKMHRFPKNIYAMRELMKHYPLLKLNPDFVLAGQAMAKAVAFALHYKAMEDAAGRLDLRPYQRVDVNYLLSLPAAGVFNDPRTGKTPTIIEVMKQRSTKVNIVVCPASLLLNWKREFERWYPECEIYIASGTKKKRERTYNIFKENDVYWSKVLVISKDTWKLDKAFFNKFSFDMCIVDEAHFLRALARSKSGKSAQADAILDINAKYRYALTGTPTIKHASEIYGILTFLYPDKFTSYWQFLERYFVLGYQGVSLDFIEGSVATKDYSDIQGVKEYRKEELQQMITFASVQRKRQDVMPWLPAKQRITHLCEMDGKQLKLYREMEMWFTATDEVDETLEVSAINCLAQLTRLRQLCLDPRLLGFDAPSAKTNAILEWLEDNPEPVVIMSMFTSYFKILRPAIEKLGLRVGELHGQMSAAEKDQSATTFQNSGYDVLLCNIISAGVGHTLDKATTIIFTDKAWNPPENEQAEDRIVPVSEERNHKIDVISLVCADSFDDRINYLLETKQLSIDIINKGGKAAIAKLLTKESVGV